MSAQYWLVKWGEEVRGPYDKTATAGEACNRAFGMVGWNMLVKPLGTRKSVFMGGSKLGDLSRSPEGWQLVPEAELDTLGRATRQSQKPIIVNGKVESEDHRRRQGRIKNVSTAGLEPEPDEPDEPARPERPPAHERAARLLDLLPDNPTLNKLDDDEYSGKRPCPVSLTIGDVRELREIIMEVAIPPLTPELEARIVRALQATWDEIGDDALALGHEDKSRDWIERHASMTRAEVAELAADAGRPVDHGVTWLELQAYYRLTDEQQQPIIRRAFPHERYGY